MKTLETPIATWAENIIVADADFLDSVVFNLTVNFERMLERRIPPADLARWCDCMALDGGVREGDNHTHVILLHEKRHEVLENFLPSSYADDINGKAFNDHLGEFTFSAVAKEEMEAVDDQLTDTVAFLLSQPSVKRLMVVPGSDDQYQHLRNVLRRDDHDKRVTLFAMQPMPGGTYQQEILGYSLMQALGIHAEEIDKKNHDMH